MSARDEAGNTASDTIDVVLDNPPDLTLTSPADGSTVSGVVSVDVSATDDQGVAGVTVYVDGASLGTASAEPYTFAWDTCDLAPGTHEILAEATDLAGNASSVTATVDNDQPLAVVLGAVVNDPATRPTASVVDDDGGVTVVFDLDGAVLDTVTTSSGAGDVLGECASLTYEADTWGSLGVTSGTYVLTATVTNSVGDTATDSVSITLDADADGDGYDATAWGGTDCDDADASVSPGASESAAGTCNGVDDDCDGGVDEDFDADGDGAPSTSSCSGDLDCDDTDASVHPGGSEVCGDGIDQDCSTEPVCGGVGSIDLEDEVKITGESAQDDFGARAWAADVNDDGYPDAIFSAPGDDDGGSDAGAVEIVLGPSFADMSAASVDAKVKGEDAGDFLTAVTSGDFDGDGVVDLLVGAPTEGTGGSNAGAAYVVSGPTSATMSLVRADAKWYGESTGDAAGTELAAGDLDGDGFDDAVIGAYSADLSASMTNAGFTYVVYGPLSGTSDLATADASIRGEAASDWAGKALAIGDLDGDGQDDLVIGASLEDSGGSGAGAAYVLLGEQTGTVGLADADTKFTGEYAADQAGCAVALGDLDDDGNTDIVIGARASSNGASYAGAVYVLSGPPAAGSIDLSTADFSATGVVAGDYAASTVGVVDYDGDGVDDLLVGVPSQDTGANNAGMAYGLFGPLAGTVSLGSSDVMLQGTVDTGYAGSSLFGMDVNLDGYGDVLIGAPYDDGPSVSTGAGYVASGGPGE